MSKEDKKMSLKIETHTVQTESWRRIENERAISWKVLKGLKLNLVHT